MIRHLIEGFVVVVAVLVAATLLAARRWPDPVSGLYGRIAALTHPLADLGSVDFATFQRRSVPNDALICPESLCQHAKPDLIGPVFPLPAAELMDKLRIVVDSEPRSIQLEQPADAPKTQARFVEYSALFYFPDVIDAVAVPAGAKASALAIYSRSVVGAGDGGVNRARLERWVAALQRIIPNP